MAEQEPLRPLVPMGWPHLGLLVQQAQVKGQDSRLEAG